jgi:hypothetical protein
MKRLLPPDFYSWSVFKDARQIDFNGHLWVRHVGNVVIDPVAISEADYAAGGVRPGRAGTAFGACLIYWRTRAF